ncbi:MAG: putative sugar O-methyltransferase [Solirubrobacteraceae bacterium]
MPSDAVARRVSDLADSSAYRAYREVRDRVLAIKDADAARGGSPSAYWQAELRWFEYMLDAGPLVVNQLRWHTHHVTGIKAYDYREHRDSKRLSARLEALRQRAAEGPDGDLFVPEHPALGGFGFHDAGGRLFNVDTLKFMEVLIALSEGAVLGAFREPRRERKVAWEIGAGWGGFAYQFKTLCPDTTYVIVDLPELFLFSAVYLRTVFPDATMRFYTEVDDAELFDDWEEVDFVFIPHTRLDLVRPPRCDLAINMVSFQEMTTEQVRGYVDHASDLGVRFLYSLNRERSRYNPELDGVSRILAERYWPHEIEVLPTSYVKGLAGAAKPTAPVRGGRAAELARRVAAGARRSAPRPPRPDDDYRHVIGWRRQGALGAGPAAGER